MWLRGRRRSNPSLGARSIAACCWQNASLRNASSDATRWPTTVPLYLDKHAFEHKLQIASEKQIVLLLLDRKGQVLGRVIGPPTAGSQSAIVAALHAAGSPLLTGAASSR